MVAKATTTSPYGDEAWYAMPAWNLAAHGSFGTPVIETSASPMPGMKVSLLGIREHTYWIMLLPILLKAGWFKLFGFSLLTLRLFSSLWALIALACWFSIMRRMSGNISTAAIAVVLIATDFFFAGRAAFGRDDMMSAALGFAGILAYLSLRARSLSSAVLASNALIVAAGLSHPNGGIASFAGLLAITVYLDRRRLEFRHASLGVFPYLAGAGFELIYILQSPQSFAAQFLGNSGGRLPGLVSIATLVPRETMRYLNIYGLDATSLASRFKLAILAVYVAGVVVTCVNEKARKQYRALLVLAGAYLGALTVFENYKVQHYALYVVPFFAAFAATGFETMKPFHPRLAGGLLAAVILLNAGVQARLILRNSYSNEYLASMRSIESHASPSSIIMGPSEIGFQYGFRDNLVDDIRLGFHSEKRPDLVLIDDRYRESFRSLEKSEPDAYSYIVQFLQTECVSVSENGNYTVYMRRSNL